MLKSLTLVICFGNDNVKPILTLRQKSDFVVAFLSESFQQIFAAILDSWEHFFARDFRA